MSGKRYDNVNIMSESSSDEEYNYGNVCYKNSDESNSKFDEDDYENDFENKRSKKRNTSSSSFDNNMGIKRGRGRSKRPCMNKNAQAARENRIRKKKHLEQVENKLSFYQQKNRSLVNVIQKQDIDIKKLKGEVTYLRCILKNNTNITALLQSMNEGLSRTSTNRSSLRNKLYNFDGKSTTLERSIAQNKHSVPENRRQFTNNIPKSQMSGTNDSRSEFDHTYTTIDKKEDMANSENDSVFNDEILMGFKKDENLGNSPTLSISDQGIDFHISDTEMEKEWSRLEVNIHDDNFPTNFNHDTLLIPDHDNLENITNLYGDNNILEEFRDAGICLHVNSDKVSLEFCSICHMNSLNSMPE